MDFVAATNRLTKCVTLAEVSVEAGVSPGLVRQARMDPEADSYRWPPEDWPEVVARLARKRAAELITLADELEP